MKTFHVLLIILFSPFYIFGYVACVAYTMLWVGWMEADEAIEKSGMEKLRQDSFVHPGCK